AYIYTTCLMAQGAKQLYFLYNPIMKVLVMGFSFAHILIQGANMIFPYKNRLQTLYSGYLMSK
ncbi:hypothetical protein NUS45_10655, partial [Glaesserella parasuis]|nr:hypothetical protein [Glaesserella parasuis]MCT8674111.1 hypothetical protein [Glaesserella parasuis]MCT8688518.1 hypothetical protein [Glaesserella parasuis]MCT8767925.1 hypothetical protein [Glaesserella parasuis]MCT8794610.1 hypothetical protein [Glaesserella parasuis]